MERHGHLCLDSEVRERLLTMSAATMDRLLAAGSRSWPSKATENNSQYAAAKEHHDPNVTRIGTNPPPGYFEMDMVAHCGNSVAGSHVHSLVLTDIASGWTEAAALMVREQTLVTVTIEEIRIQIAVPNARIGCG